MLKAIVGYIVQAFLGWAYDLFSSYLKKKQIQKENEEKNRKAKEALEKAETPEEIDDAAKGIADKF